MRTESKISAGDEVGASTVHRLMAWRCGVLPPLREMTRQWNFHAERSSNGSRGDRPPVRRSPGRWRKSTPAAYEHARASMVGTSRTVGVSVLSVETISFTPRPSRVETGRLCRWASASQVYCEIKPLRPTNGTSPRGIQVLTKSFQLVAISGGSQQRFHPYERTRSRL